jgi:hypothetical protein
MRDLHDSRDYVDSITPKSHEHQKLQSEQMHTKQMEAKISTYMAWTTSRKYYTVAHIGWANFQQICWSGFTECAHLGITCENEIVPTYRIHLKDQKGCFFKIPLKMLFPLKIIQS